MNNEPGTAYKPNANERFIGSAQYENSHIVDAYSDTLQRYTYASRTLRNPDPQDYQRDEYRKIEFLTNSTNPFWKWYVQTFLGYESNLLLDIGD